MELDVDVEAGEGGVDLGVGVPGQNFGPDLDVADDAVGRAVVELLEVCVGHHHVRHVGLVDEVHGEHRAAHHDDADDQQRAQDHRRPHPRGAPLPGVVRVPRPVPPMAVMTRARLGRPLVVVAVLLVGLHPAVSSPHLMSRALRSIELG